MNKNKKMIASAALLIAMGIILSACGGPAEPTPDANLIYTQAAETVAVQLTQTAAAQPTATQTNTPEPTATPEPTEAIPTLPLPGEGTPQSTAQIGLPGLNTATPAPANLPDKADWVSNDPQDGIIKKPGEKFDLVWVMKNTGTTTWTTKYTYRYYAGDKLHENANSYFFPKDVKPGDTVELLIDAMAPETAGSKYALWVLTNEEGANFGRMDFTLVVEGATLTPSATPE